MITPDIFQFIETVASNTYNRNYLKSKSMKDRPLNISAAMKILDIDYDAIQRAMEDVQRSASDYYLDSETGEVMELVGDIVETTLESLYGGHPVDDNDEDILFDSELDTSPELTDEDFDHIEEAVNIIPEADRYLRIPERQSAEAFECMRAFTDELEGGELKNCLIKALDGVSAFRKFKSALKPFPDKRKEWNRFNAMKMRKVIKEWLGSYGIVPVRRRNI